MRYRIRLHVLGYIIQRACRKAEDDRREREGLQDAPPTDESTESTEEIAHKDDFTAPSSFVEAVHVSPSGCARNTTLESDTSLDELSPEYVASSSKGSDDQRHTKAPNSQSRKLGPSPVTQYSSAYRRNMPRVSVVIRSRKRADARATILTSSKRKRGESSGKSSTVLQSSWRNNGDMSGRGPQAVDPWRTTVYRKTSVKAPGASLESGTSLNTDLVAGQLLRDQVSLGIQLPKLLEPHSPGCNDIADMKETIELIETIALNDARRLRKVLGDSHNDCKTSLDRWLACMRAHVNFREATDLQGDKAAISAGFENLSSKKKKARGPCQEMYREILAWCSKDGFTIAAFSKEVGSILLEMASFGLLEMKLEELLEDLIPFTTSLVEFFGAIPPSRAG
jgi:hypothetical protein